MSAGYRVRETLWPGSRWSSWLILSVFIFLVIPVGAAKKPANADCLACHGDATLTHEVDGKPENLGVDEGKFTASIHGSILGCVDCHEDVKSAPHEVSRLNCPAPSATPRPITGMLSASTLRRGRREMLTLPLVAPATAVLTKFCRRATPSPEWLTA